MAVSLYCGVPGSGKSYEVVAYVILPALANGRRVVTNTAGLNEDLIRNHIVQKMKTAVDDIGELVCIDDEDLRKPGFFPVDGDDSATVVKAGDLVVIDEAWKFWGSRAPIPSEHTDFFRKHRHLTHPVTGVSCDLVVIAQAPSFIKKEVRDVVEISFNAKKLKSVGLNSAYRVNQYGGGEQRGKPFGTQKRRYRKEIFPLYKSYSGSNGADGKEMAVDDRQNLLNRPIVWATLVFVVALFGWGVWTAVAFFNPGPIESKSVPQLKTHEAQAVLTPASLTQHYNERQAGASAPTRVPQVREIPISPQWRLAGFLSVSGRMKVLLIDASGRIRYTAASQFSFEDGKPVSGVVDGERVTPWSGKPVGSSSSPANSVAPMFTGVVGG
jgi:zona occludens toxin